jgi:hypothetical protein
MVEEYNPERRVGLMFLWEEYEHRRSAFRVSTEPAPCDTVYLGDIGQVRVSV